MYISHSYPNIHMYIYIYYMYPKLSQYVCLPKDKAAKRRLDSTVIVSSHFSKGFHWKTWNFTGKYGDFTGKYGTNHL